MHKFNPRILIPVALIITLASVSRYVANQRAKERSVLSGYFESQPAQLSSRVQGRVAQILAREGDTVRTGQSLITLESTPASEDLEAKKSAAEQARQRQLEAVNGSRQEEIARQAAVVAEVEANLKLLRNGALPEEIALARAKLQAAEANLRRVNSGARPQEVEQAKAAERAAQARLAQAERGLTTEEKAQAKARVDAALAQENLAQLNAARMSSLFNQGAISAQQNDQAQAELRTAIARRQELQEALLRANKGTPAEELEQVRQQWRQAKAALDLVLAGSRSEDKEAANAERRQAQEALKLVLRGARPEDIRAAEARLSQARAMLIQLQAGTRVEQIATARAATRAAEATVRGAQATLNDSTIRSSQDAVVERVLVAVGDLVSPGTPVARIADPKDIWLRIYIPELRLSHVKVGDDAELKLDGIATNVAAKVESIASRGEFTPANLQTPDERGKQVFSVRLRLNQADSRIKAGMAATVIRIGGWVP